MKTKKIPFNLERWQKGGFVRVETRGGDNVSQLTHFNVRWQDCLYGVLLCDGEDSVYSWDEDGHWLNRTGAGFDLCLIVEDMSQNDESSEPEEEYVWKYVVQRDATRKIEIYYYMSENERFVNGAILKKEKVKISEL